MQTTVLSGRDLQGSFVFCSAASFQNPEDFSQSLSGLRASAQDIAIHQDKRLSRKQKESLLLFFQSSEPGSFQGSLRA
jgi:hypothetical protein